MDNKVSQIVPSERKNTTWLPTCHSTNTYATNWARQNELKEGWAVYTFRQTNGRGQADNVWESEFDKNLTFSVVYSLPFLLPKNQFLLNMAVSLSIVSFFESMGFLAKIKWPNDIYIEGKKVGGILIENQLRGNRFRFSVIGVGINVNQTSFITSKACSMRSITGVQYDLVRCLDRVLDCMEEWIKRLEGQEEGIWLEYHQHMYLLGLTARFRSVSEKEMFYGTIQGVDENGKLILSTENGLSYYGLKEIEFI